MDADKGFNEVLYDVSFSKKGRKAFVSKYKESALKNAKNGKYYLPKGVYTVKLESATGRFEIF